MVQRVEGSRQAACAVPPSFPGQDGDARAGPTGRGGAADSEDAARGHGMTDQIRKRRKKEKKQGTKNYRGSDVFTSGPRRGSGEKREEGEEGELGRGRRRGMAEKGLWMRKYLLTLGWRRELRHQPCGENE